MEKHAFPFQYQLCDYSSKIIILQTMSYLYQHNLCILPRICAFQFSHVCLLESSASIPILFWHRPYSGIEPIRKLIRCYGIKPQVWPQPKLELRSPIGNAHQPRILSEGLLHYALQREIRIAPRPNQYELDRFWQNFCESVEDIYETSGNITE